jgi:hypothetical protein
MASSSEQGAHPLAERLVATARERSLAGPVLEVGTGSGRNTRALVAAGLTVDAIADDIPYTQLPAAGDTYVAALATHAYLHGSSDKVRVGLAELRRVLAIGAPAFVTMGSIRDARYGLGIRFDDRSFAPGDGDEAGIPHAYFDRDGVLEALRGFTIVSCDEVDVDAIVGRWAHDDAPVGRVHWFVVATKDAALTQ